MFRGFVLSLACAFSVAAGTAQAADTSVTPRTYKVWQWNVAGNTIHDGSLTDGLVDQAVDSIVNRGADFAAFNELCENQYSAIITELRARAWPVDGNTSFARFESSLPAGDPDVCAGNAYGNALFSTSPCPPTAPRKRATCCARPSPTGRARSSARPTSPRTPTTRAPS